MPKRSPGATLTILAMLLALMVISNLHKPFAHHPGEGFVFFGTRLSGTANQIVAPIFAAFLAVYVYGILAMRKFALPLGIFYAAYVILNMLLFVLKYHGTAVTQEHSWAYLIPYPFVAIGVSSGAAWLLYRRRNESQ
jgi:cell division protein FtsW (lipid II flippase)